MEQHKAITDALRAKDETLAAELIQRHIAEFQQEIKAVL
jgi:DNA-binding GntR family transcriptional regulator